MTLRLSILTFVLTLVLHPRALHAQEDFRFQPPRPPPLDVDFDDEDEEMGDEFARIPVPGAPAVMNPGANNKVDTPPPPVGATPPGQAPPAGAPAGGSGAGGNFGSSVTAGKFRFRVVEGEYWAKGKKRTRGKETHVSGSEDSRGGGGAGLR